MTEPALYLPMYGEPTRSTAVTTCEPAVGEQGAAGAARALRAVVPGRNALSEAEGQLLAEWLRRLPVQPLARGGGSEPCR